ncbi:MAG: energy-coupling factor transporter transmembrane protein EcfT [Clostridia bacterium]|nr:energy-coupling factor transporter transmembrane protein EcfT [Clostridia bacterium]
MSELSRVHPAVKLLFFLLLLGVVMFADNMILRGFSLVTALFTLSLYGRGFRDVMKYSAMAVAASLFAAVINCIVSHNGKTVLFKIGRLPYTMEAVICGLSLGMMISATALWCLILSEELQSGDIVYLFGRVLPKVAVLIMITLRYIPEIIRKYNEIFESQRMMGLFDKNKLRKKIAVVSAVFMSTTERSLEDALDASLAMKGKGFGLPGRKYAFRRGFKLVDITVLLITLVLAGFAIYGIAYGDVGFQYYPTIKMTWMYEYSIVAYTVCGMILLLPAAVNVYGRLRWKHYTSKI